jgi:hypothetical protein
MGGGPMVLPHGDATFLDCQFDEDFDVDCGDFPDAFDPRRDAMFRKCGFTDDDTYVWAVNNGWKSGIEAAGWKNAGFDAETAAVLRDEGISARTAKEFAAHGITDPHQINNWDSAGIAPGAVRGWQDAGFDVSDPAPAEDAARWAATGMTPASAEAWADGHYWAEEAAGHAQAGLDPTSAPEPTYNRVRREKAADFAAVAIAPLKWRHTDIVNGTAGVDLGTPAGKAESDALNAALRAAKRRKV